MRLLTHILSPNNTGAPDYNICGQGASVVSQTNMKCILTLSDGTTSVTILNVSNLAVSTILDLNGGVKTFSDLGIDVANFSVNPVTGLLSLDIDFLQSGTSDLTTWNKIYLTIHFEKSGYLSYDNVIQLYGYDIGNDSTDFSTTDNIPFDIYLINKSNNLDSEGRQTRAFSKFAILRQPFTNNVFFYNLVATQGNISYKTGSTQIGTGYSGTTCVTSNNCNDNSIVIVQSITVCDSSGNANVCTYSLKGDTTIWLPTVTSSVTCPEACNDDINNISEVIASVTTDYSKVTKFRINGENQFLTHYFTNYINFTLFDFQGSSFDTSLNNLYSIDYASYIVDPTSSLIPTSFTILPPPLGDCKVEITSTFNSDTETLITLNMSSYIKVCNWWKVDKKEDCGSYTITNCSSNPISVILQQMQDDRTFSDITTIEIDSFSSSEIIIQNDGVYLIKVPSRDLEGVFEYYSIISFCAFEACYLNFLNKVICFNPKDDCTTEEHYKFNMFLINANTFFMALNEEYNFSFIYSTITDSRIQDLYTLNSFIVRFKEYCASDLCIPCANS